MPLATLDIDKNWDKKSTISEDNWGEIKTKTEAWAGYMVNDLYQLGKDVYGNTYDFFNTDRATTFRGNPYLTSIQGYVDSTPIGSINPDSGVFTTLIYSPAQTRHLCISSMSFICHQMLFQSGDLYNVEDMLRNSSGVFNPRSFHAPIFLPHNAVIDTWTVYYTRTPGAGDMNVHIYKYDYSVAGGGSIISTAVCGDSSGARHADTSGSLSETIDNSKYGYAMNVSITNNAAITENTFHCAKITYEVTHAWC